MFKLHNYFRVGDTVYPNAVQDYYSALQTKQPFGKYMILGKAGGGFDWLETELVEINTDIIEGAFCAVYAVRVEKSDSNYISAALSPLNDGTKLVNRADIQFDGSVSEISCTVYLEYTASMIEFVGGVNALAGFLLGANGYATSIKMKAGNLYLPNKPFYRDDIGTTEGVGLSTKFVGGELSYEAEFSNVDVRELLLLWDAKPVLRCFNTNLESVINTTVIAQRSKALQIKREFVTDVFNVRDRNNNALDFSMTKSEFTLEKRDILKFDMGANARFVGEPDSKYALIVNDKEVLVLTIQSDRPKFLGRIEKISDEVHLTSNGSVVFKQLDDIVIYQLANGYSRLKALRYALGKSDQWAIVYEPNAYQVGIVNGAEFKRYALTDGVRQLGETINVTPNQFYVCAHEKNTLAYGGVGQTKGCGTIDTVDSATIEGLEEFFEDYLPVTAQLDNTRAVFKDDYGDVYCLNYTNVSGDFVDTDADIKLLDKFFVHKTTDGADIYTIDRGADSVNHMGNIPLDNVTSAVWLGDYALFTVGDGVCHSYYLWSKRWTLWGNQFPRANVYMSVRQLSSTMLAHSTYKVVMKLIF